MINKKHFAKNKALCSFTTLSPLPRQKKMWNVTCDIWQVTCGKWHMTCDTWHVTCGGRGTFSQNFSSLALTVLEWRFDDYIVTNHDLMNDEAVYRRAPGYPGSVNNSIFLLICSWKEWIYLFWKRCHDKLAQTNVLKYLWFRTFFFKTRKGRPRW